MNDIKKIKTRGNIPGELWEFLRIEILPVNRYTLWAVRAVYTIMGALLASSIAYIYLVNPDQKILRLGENNNKLIEYKLNKETKIISIFIKLENKRVPKSIANEIAYWTVNISKKTGIPVSVIMGIMKIESNYNPLARSSVKAAGLMQVLDGGSIIIDKNQIYDIKYNINKGTEILREHLRMRKGDLDKALFGYVNKDKEYMPKVYKAISKFIFFKSKYTENEDWKYFKISKGKTSIKLAKS